ncbi:MAG TPA: LCP family protein [Actinophytocola sp.]|uniref:LCP family protein n=1 Tax=Actinophytocola sp. TaxID=1872138 RepID=UPI002E016996|nr:LCP family protein [Actinophytocola sp.]
MEGTGGLSVADLVQRHTGSRPDLPYPPQAEPPRPHAAPSQPRMQPAAPPPSQPRMRPVPPPAEAHRQPAAPPQPRRQPAPPSQPRMQPIPPPAATAFPPSQSRMQPVPPPAQHRPPARPADGPPGPRRMPPGPSEPSGAWPRPGQGPNGGNGAAPNGGQFANGAAPTGNQFATGGRPGGQSAPMRQRTATQSAPPMPRIPNQIPGHQTSMPPAPSRLNAQPPAAAAPPPAWPTESPSMTAVPPVAPPRRPAAEDMDPLCLTSEMEPIGEEIQKRRRVDHTLARFSKVHDELRAEEREKKAKRRKLIPWSTDDELDHLDEMVALQSPQLPVEEPFPAEIPAEETRLQRKKSRRRNRSALVGKVFAGVLAILVLVATGVAWGFKSWVDAKTNQVDALDQNSSAILDRIAQNGDENFLMVGSDSRDGAAAEDKVGNSADVPGARSDTIMIAHVPADRKRAVVVSFPRDLEVNRPQCEAWDPKTTKYTGKQIPAATNVKINTAFQVGGPKCVTKMVQQLSGLNINHFVGIDFNGFKEMVDAVDGVQVCVERPLKDTILGTVVKEAGKAVTLTGDQALNFVRARHVINDPTSDYGRIKRQQRFLSSLLRKAMSNQVLLDPGKLTSFVQAFAKSTFGDNIGVEQLMLLGQSMQGIEAGRVTFITVPTVGEANTRGNEVLRTNDKDNLFAAVRKDTPLPGESPAPATGQSPTSAAPPTQQVDPKTIKIQVLNGGNTTQKIATRTADKLKALGFQIVTIDNALEKVKQTVVKYGKDKEAAARVLASAVPGAQMLADPSATGALMLIIGPEYKGDVVAPTGVVNSPPADLPKDLATVNGGDVSCA